MNEGLYERVFAHGASSLSDEQLLRVLLRNGSKAVPLTATVTAILQKYPHLARFDRATGQQLTAIGGIGLSKAVGLIASLELGRRVSAQENVRYGEIHSIEKLGQRLIKQFAGLKQERFIAIYLDARLAVIEQALAAIGSISTAQADPQVVFRQALLVNASYVIIAHNHPSGDPAPSSADLAVTTRFIDAGEMIGVAMVDHLVIGRESYYSFAQADEALNFFK